MRKKEEGTVAGLEQWWPNATANDPRIPSAKVNRSIPLATGDVFPCPLSPELQILLASVPIHSKFQTCGASLARVLTTPLGTVQLWR